MRAEYELGPDGTLYPTNETGYGGARAGAGRKEAGYVKPESGQKYDTARARKEAALADKYEFANKVEAGLYVERQAVAEASATLLATLAQNLRSIPDNLERKFHLPADVAEAVEAVINSALSDVAEGLALYTTEDVG